MAKYREIVFDVLKDLKQVHDDATITNYQVLWWVSMVANKFLKAHLDNEYNRTGQKSGKFLAIFPSVKVQTSFVPKGRKFVDLPAVLLDMDYNRSIEYITYQPESEEVPMFSVVKFSFTTPAQAQLLQASHETPTSQNPYAYVAGQKIYFLGLEQTDVKEVEMGLYLAVDPRQVSDLDAECPLPEHLISQMKYEIVNLGRFVMSIPADNVNDGKDTIQVTPPKNVAQNEQQ